MNPGAILLDDLTAFLRKYMFMSQEAISALALWVLHTHSFAASSRTPYIRVESPAPECGKTNLVELLEMLVARPCLTMGITKSVLVRTIDAETPTLLMDEVDQQFKGDRETTAVIIGVLNGGYKASGTYSMSVPDKQQGWVSKHFRTFCPKLFSGLGGLNDTLRSRSILIRLDRMPHGYRLAEIDEFITEPEAKALRERAAQWAAESIDALRIARPQIEGLGHRQREVTRPLLAIADFAGDEWPTIARDALTKLFSDGRSNDPSLGELLLSDIKTVFEEKGTDAIPSRDLIEHLNLMEDRPWPEFNKGKPITGTTLARLLKKFGIGPRPIKRQGNVFKGYSADIFRDAWERYCPPVSPVSDSERLPELPPACLAAETHILQRLPDAVVTDSKMREHPINTREVTGVTAKGQVREGTGGNVKKKDDDDYLLRAAIAHCRQTGAVSVTAIMNALLVSRVTAIAYMDQMEKLGLIGPAVNGEPRPFPTQAVQ